MGLLTYLVRSRGRTVPVDEVLAQLWPGDGASRAIKLNRLNQLYRELRHYLEEDLGGPAIHIRKLSSGHFEWSPGYIPCPRIVGFQPTRPVYSFGGGKVEALRLWGADTMFATLPRVSVHYRHVEFDMPEELRAAADAWIEHVKALAKAKRRLFFNGPAAGLAKWQELIVDGAGVALEKPILELHLKPVGWYDFEGLNGRLRGTLRPDEYETYLGISHILRNGDVSYSRLTNILDCVVTVVTRDGYAGYQVRSDRNAAKPNGISSSVAENINRYRDETSLDGARLINERIFRASAGSEPDSTYYPGRDGRSVPHPFAAALRGIRSELSPMLTAHMGPNSLKLSGLSYSLESYQPDALFIAAVNADRDDVLRMCSEHPGDEFHEGQLCFIPARFTDDFVQQLFRKPDWVPAGLASVVRAIELALCLMRECDGDWRRVFQTLFNAE